MNRVDPSLAKGLARGAHRRAPFMMQLNDDGKNRRTESRVRFIMREATRLAGDHLVEKRITGKGRQCRGTIIWLEKSSDMLGLWLGYADKTGENLVGINTYISHHAMQRLFERLNTTSLRKVAPVCGDAARAIVQYYIDHRGIFPDEFATEVAGGFLLFRHGSVATTYLAGHMKHQLRVLPPCSTLNYQNL